MDDFRGGFEPRPSDIFVAVMGVTGAGKSTFISTCTDVDVPIGHNLQACTQNVSVYRYEYAPSVNIYLVDTPGFDDTSRSDTEVLREIAAWLTESYSNKVRLRGVLYLHRITDLRMQGSAKKNLFMFKKLCGPDALKNVILVTTMWEKVDQQDGENREAELMATPEFWGFMMDQGSQVYRHQNNLTSAKRALEMFLAESIEQPAITLDIQDEMVNGHMSLDQTGAGRELEGVLEQERERFQRDISDLRQMMREALELRDKESAEQLRQQKEEMALHLEKIRQDREELKVSMERLHREKFERMETQLNETQEANRAAFEKLQLDHRAQVQRLEMQAEEALSEGSITTLEPSGSAGGGMPEILKLNKSMHQPKAPRNKQFNDLILALQGQYYYVFSSTRLEKNVARNCLRHPDKGSNLGFVSFGTNASYLKLSWLDKDNHKYYLAKSPNFETEYPILHKLLFEGDECPAWVALGSEGTFFYPGKKGPKYNLPNYFPLSEIPLVKMMWLGYGGTWVVQKTTGAITFTLRGHYGNLGSEIRKSNQQIGGLAMDLTDPSKSLVVFKDGSSWYSRATDDKSPGLSRRKFESFVEDCCQDQRR